MIYCDGLFQPGPATRRALLDVEGWGVPRDTPHEVHYAAAVADPLHFPLSIRALAGDFIARLDSLCWLWLKTHTGTTANGFTEVRAKCGRRLVTGSAIRDVQGFDASATFGITISVRLNPNFTVGNILQILCHELAAHALPWARMIEDFRANPQAGFGQIWPGSEESQHRALVNRWPPVFRDYLAARQRFREAALREDFNPEDENLRQAPYWSGDAWSFRGQEVLWDMRNHRFLYVGGAPWWPDGHPESEFPPVVTPPEEDIAQWQ